MRKESLEVNSFPMINKNRKKRGQWVRGADTLPFAGKEARGMEKKTYSYIVSAEEMKRYDSNTRNRRYKIGGKNHERLY